MLDEYFESAGALEALGAGSGDFFTLSQRPGAALLLRDDTLNGDDDVFAPTHAADDAQGNAHQNFSNTRTLNSLSQECILSLYFTARMAQWFRRLPPQLLLCAVLWVCSPQGSKLCDSRSVVPGSSVLCVKVKTLAFYKEINKTTALVINTSWKYNSKKINIYMNSIIVKIQYTRYFFLDKVQIITRVLGEKYNCEY